MRDENLVGTAVKHGFRAEIWTDYSPESPREWDNFGTMVCFHRRYRLGDSKRKTEDWSVDNMNEKVSETIAGGGIVLPLYLYDHSGITISLGRFDYVDSRGWDWGQVGWIICSGEQIEKEFKGDRERATKCLEAEVETYDLYLRGEIYGYTVYKLEICPTCSHCEEKPIESCGGFYGHDPEKNGMLEDAPKEFRELLKQAYENRR